VVLMGDDDGMLGRALRSVALPGAVEQSLVAGATSSNPALAGKVAAGQCASAYVCVGPQCSTPLHDADSFTSALRAQRGASVQ
jgi:uncharacterized protein